MQGTRHKVIHGRFERRTRVLWLALSSAVDNSLGRRKTNTMRIHGAGAEIMSMGWSIRWTAAAGSAGRIESAPVHGGREQMKQLGGHQNMDEGRRRIGDHKVLVVDDDVAVRLLIRETLETAGLTVEEAENGTEALAAVSRVRPHVVLMNVNLPGLDGPAACSKLRELPGADELTIVMVTDIEDLESVRRSYEVGATDFVTKPINPSILTHRVLSLLRADEVLRALRESEDRLARVQRAAHIGSWDWNIETNQLQLSEEARRMYGLAPDEETISRGRFLDLIHSGDRRNVTRAVADALQFNEACSISYRVNRPDGSECVVHELAEPRVDDAGTAVRVCATVKDVTERERAEEQIRMLAYYDALTGLPNRQQFREQAGHAVTAARRVGTKMALIYLDLDHFKRFNDTLGHTAGDTLLRGVAKALTSIVRGTDIVAKVDIETSVSSSLARLGGDEFTIMLTGLRRSESAARVAKRIQQALSRPLKIDDREYVVTGSMGIAIYPDDGEDVDLLLKNADIAMYAAKGEGRNTYRFFSEDMNARMQERLALESDLRRALERNELVVHFQPQVEAQTGKIVALEALVRWQHPQRGLLPPLEFIGIAEETGLIIPLGEWVMRTACAQAVAWREAGFAPMRVSVNVSSQQLTQSDLVATVRQVLDTTRLAGEYLELEITESSLMSDVEATTQTLRGLKEAGLTLSVDDFGTGYSSMNYLKRFPLDALKIDQSFVRDLTVDANDAAITKAVIALAKALDLSTVAEGVEEDDQLQFLVNQGCDLIQGFLISRPMPAEKIGPFLESRAQPE
jgi:diguanylate cyclase (GGDEF)-like protein/PAS domain S-box-containing protein